MTPSFGLEACFLSVERRPWRCAFMRAAELELSLRQDLLPTFRVEGRPRFANHRYTAPACASSKGNTRRRAGVAPRSYAWANISIGCWKAEAPSRLDGVRIKPQKRCRWSASLSNRAPRRVSATTTGLALEVSHMQSIGPGSIYVNCFFMVCHYSS